MKLRSNRENAQKKATKSKLLTKCKVAKSESEILELLRANVEQRPWIKVFNCKCS